MPPMTSDIAGLSRGVSAQHARTTSAMSRGASAGIMGRSPFITTRRKISLARDWSAQGTLLVRTSHATIPKL